MDDAWGSDTFDSSSSRVKTQEADVLEQPAVATKAAQKEKVLRPQVSICAKSTRRETVRVQQCLCPSPASPVVLSLAIVMGIGTESIGSYCRQAPIAKTIRKTHCIGLQLRPVADVVKELRVKDFAYEICILAGLVLYIINMIVGARTNRQLANKWCMMFGIGQGILPQQFAYVGIGELSAPAIPDL